MRTFFFFCFLLAISSQANAWGELGHRMVGELAEPQLTPQARAAIAELLDGEPEPSLAGVASWADELRANDPDLGKRSSPWHYLNFPRPQPGDTGDNCHYQAERDCRNGDCVVGAIQTQLRILGDHSQPLLARQQALKFVVHFIGDVHQPLHAGYFDDKGGNTVQIHHAGEGTNLHWVWDHWLIHSRGFDSSPRFAAHLQAVGGNAHTHSPSSPDTWAEESCRIVAGDGFYPSHRHLPERYITHYGPVVDQRLVQAAQRLAASLNQTLGSRAD